MPLYLVRETFVPGPVSVVAADVVTEYEVDAPNAHAAALMVMDRRPGRRDPLVSVRTSRDPYTNAYLAPESGRYEEIVGIQAGNPGTLPRPPMLHGVAEAVKAIFAANRELARIDDEGIPSVALYHVLRSVIDLAAATGIRLDRVVDDILSDYETITGSRKPEVSVSEGKFEHGGGDATIGAALASVNAEAIGLDIGDDPEVALFHLMFTLINYSEHVGIDFQVELEEAIRDARIDGPVMRA